MSLTGINTLGMGTFYHLRACLFLAGILWVSITLTAWALHMRASRSMKAGIMVKDFIQQKHVARNNLFVFSDFRV